MPNSSPILFSSNRLQPYLKQWAQIDLNNNSDTKKDDMLSEKVRKEKLPKKKNSIKNHPQASKLELN